LKISRSNNSYYKNISSETENIKTKIKSSKNQDTDKLISKDYKIRQRSVEKLKEIDKMERKAKINRLKKEIQSGEYKVNPEELAEIIVDIAMS